MEITWYARDGYCGDGPQELGIDDEEIKNCETEEEALALIEEAIEEDFRQKVSWSYEREDVAEEVRALLAQKEEETEEE